MDVPSFAPQKFTADRLGEFFLRVTRGLIIAVVATLPLLFVPGLTTLTGVMKTYLVLAAVLLALVAYSLGVLRRGSIAFRFPLLLVGWWSVVAAAVVAGLMAPQVKVAFLGTGLEIHTVGFLLLGGVLMTMMQLFREVKPAIVYLYGGLFVSAFVLALWHIARLMFGADALSFGILSSSAATLVGSFNDLALFLTLVVLVGLISLLQLTLPKALEIALAVIMVVSLVMLGVINFSAVWFVLGLFSLLLLMYALTKGRIGAARTSTPPSIAVTVLSLVVFMTSLVFIIGGASLGSTIAAKTGISYLEVRPSMTATLDILKATYQENAFTGSGPNHFNEAWTLHKDQSLNQSLFWNTPFNAGNGYITTWFVTGGLLAVIAWLGFIALFVVQGVRTLLRSSASDQFWYFIATVSFAVAAFVWGMALFYVPGPVILFLGFVCTGLFIVAGEALSQKSYRTVNLLTNTRSGFVLIATVMIVIIGAVGVGYQASRHVAAFATFASASSIPVSENQVAEVTTTVARAYGFYQSDTFVRDLAAYQLREIQILAAKANPTAADTQRFGAILTASLESSSAAIAQRRSDARNWRVRGDIYSVLATAKIEGAYDRAVSDYNEARVRDPQNPYYDAQGAILAMSKDDAASARAALAEALKKKPNYTDALILLSQMDIAAGNIDEAIKSTEALISLESTNPGRYYQLGVLLSAKGSRDMAISAFSQAVALNPQYANARYLRAIEVLATGDKDTALAELAIVRDLNPDNAVVTDLIGKIERNEVTADTIKNGQTNSVSEPAPETTTDGEVTTVSTAPDTDLLTPINTVPTTASSTPTE